MISKLLDLRITKTSERAFTLIELLVVIAIIGLLSSIVLASLNTARAKAADNVRASEMIEIQKAVEEYNIDNGHYPNSNGKWASFDASAYAANPIVTPAAASLTAALAPYIPPVIDPLANVGGLDSGYLYIGDNADYCILVYRVPQNMSDFNPRFVNYAPTRCGTIQANGQCSNGINSVYVGYGTYANGC